MLAVHDVTSEIKGKGMFTDLFTIENLVLLSSGAIAAIAMLVADKMIHRAITRYSKRIKLEKHAENILKLVARIIV